ncbi:hypothetical protein GLYMA_15G207800v4 [Glycine max]|nr:hypothetical protein GLYMA_15G207800v4 [Glycine max]KAH1148137.1 hypothetical protein GYH30_043009 [Glycine max]
MMCMTLCGITDFGIGLVGLCLVVCRNTIKSAHFAYHHERKRTLWTWNIIAEDLGVMTEDVIQLRRSTGAPGMAVLQFDEWGSCTRLLHREDYIEHPTIFN